jgi:predicted Zn-dependent peptidase
MVLFAVGSRYEDENKAGISHVLEHMFYKGTKNRPNSLKISEFIDEIGGEHNAFTSKEYTGFYTKVSYPHLDKSIDFLSDLLSNPIFDKKQLEKEKNVILQEYDMYEDLPMEVVSSRFERALYGKNSLGRDVIGYKDRILSITSEDLFDYKDQFYVGENCAIVLVGNFNKYSNEQIVDLVSKKFKFVTGHHSKFKPINFEGSSKITEEKRKTEQSHLVIGFRGAAYGDIDRYKLRLLGILLGGSMSSRLFTEIREKRGLAYSVRTSSTSYLDTGAFETYAGVPHTKVNEAVEAILQQHSAIKKAITEQEAAKAKEIVNGRMLISFEDTNDVANHFALSEILFGKILTPNELFKIYQQITPSDLVDVADKYFTNESLTLSFVGKDLVKYKINNLLKV